MTPNKYVLNWARNIKAWCECVDCRECPFGKKTINGFRCRLTQEGITFPANWDLDKEE